MISPVNNKIIVRVNISQKDTMTVGGIVLSTATKFETNYREKSPVIAEVIHGNEHIKDGDIIVCHHNHFYHPSPYHLTDDLYSIPFNHTILATINRHGVLSAVCRNVLGERVSIKTEFELPPEYRKNYVDRMIIKDKGWTNYENDTLVFCRPNAPYDIVYNFNGVEKRITKLDSEQICGVLR